MSVVICSDSRQPYVLPRMTALEKLELLSHRPLNDSELRDYVTIQSTINAKLDAEANFDIK